MLRVVHAVMHGVVLQANMDTTGVNPSSRHDKGESYRLTIMTRGAAAEPTESGRYKQSS